MTNVAIAVLYFVLMAEFTPKKLSLDKRLFSCRCCNNERTNSVAFGILMNSMLDPESYRWCKKLPQLFLVQEMRPKGILISPTKSSDVERRSVYIAELYYLFDCIEAGINR